MVALGRTVGLAVYCPSVLGPTSKLLSLFAPFWTAHKSFRI